MIPNNGYVEKSEVNFHKWLSEKDHKTEKECKMIVFYNVKISLNNLSVEVKNTDEYDSLVAEIQKTILTNYATKILDQMEITIEDITNGRSE